MGFDTGNLHRPTEASSSVISIFVSTGLFRSAGAAPVHRGKPSIARHVIDTHYEPSCIDS